MGNFILLLDGKIVGYERKQLKRASFTYLKDMLITQHSRDGISWYDVRYPHSQKGYIRHTEIKEWDGTIKENT